jgi:hypothetical protein
LSFWDESTAAAKAEPEDGRRCGCGESIHEKFILFCAQTRRVFQGVTE